MAHIEDTQEYFPEVKKHVEQRAKEAAEQVVMKDLFQNVDTL